MVLSSNENGGSGSGPERRFLFFASPPNRANSKIDGFEVKSFVDQGDGDKAKRAKTYNRVESRRGKRRRTK